MLRSIKPKTIVDGPVIADALSYRGNQGWETKKYHLGNA
jgi:hypothetical protein